ncbi:MAG: hypothetical protein AABW82_01025 [Nanoarchaeota archaeon]
MNSKNIRLVAQSHFDSNSDRLKTLQEARDCINDISFRDTDFAGKQVYVFSREGYVVWNLDAKREVVNYNLHALTSHYNGQNISSFVDERVRDSNLLLMIPMDVASLQAIQEADGAFDEQARYSHLGVPKRVGLKHSVSSYSSPVGGPNGQRMDLRNQP